MKKKPKKSKKARTNKTQRFTKATAVSIVFLLLGSALVAGITSATSENTNSGTQPPVVQKDLAQSVIGLKEKDAVERVKAAGYAVKIIRSGAPADTEKPDTKRITLYVAGDTVLMAANA